MTVIHSKRKAHLQTKETGEELVDIGIRYSCDHCYRDISAIPRVQCAECGVPNFGAGSTTDGSATTTTAVGATSDAKDEVDLCVECFGKGVEFGKHKKTHSYRIIKPLDFPLYEADWRADEELLLLEAVESNGMGAWLDIADQIGSKSAQDCENHYRKLYLDWDGRPLPNPKYQVEPKPIDRHSMTVDQMLPKKRLKREGSIEASTGATPLSMQSQPANHEITGYMPGRLEFETEFENEAESIVKDIIFLDEDTPFETQLKLAMLEVYSGILDRRKARRDFCHQHNLIDFKKFTAQEKARSKEERELYNHLKPFARLISSEDFYALLDGLVKEEELRRRIGQLQEYRRMGLRSLDEVPAYEGEKKHLELYLKGGSLPANKAGGATGIVASREPFPLPHPSNNMIRSELRTSNQFLSSLVQSQQILLAGTGSVGSRKASMPLNISHAEGVELLSEKEREICSILRLYPRLYLTIKDTLIRECLRLGGLKRAQARAAVKIDVNKTSKLYDFFITAGWIKPPASGE